MSRKTPNYYGIDLKLDNDAKLKIMILGDEHKWAFEYGYSPQDVREKPIIIQNTQLFVHYDNGAAEYCELNVDIKRLDKIGQRHFLGIDISPGAFLVAGFMYEKETDIFKLKTIDLGSHGRYDGDSLEEVLTGVSDFTIPVERQLFNFSGQYKVPFLKNDGEKAFFTFPAKYVR